MTSPDLRALLPTPTGAVLRLFDGPYLEIAGRRREVPEGSKRLIAFIALNGGRVERRVAAGTLWPVGNDTRAAGNLRSAMWRLRGAGIDVIESDKGGLWLSSGTVVDHDVVSDWAARLIEGTATDADLSVLTWSATPFELLPGWYEEWVVFERERLRQRLLHGLEALSRHLARSGRTADAVQTAAVVVGIDPLRESAQRVLIEAHLAVGDVAAAERSYDSYCRIVFRELRVPPGTDLNRLLANVVRGAEFGQPTCVVAGAGVR